MIDFLKKVSVFAMPIKTDNLWVKLEWKNESFFPAYGQLVEPFLGDFKYITIVSPVKLINISVSI